MRPPSGRYSIATAPAQAAKPPALPRYAAWDKDGVKIIPILIANVNYNSSPLDPAASWPFPNPDAK